MVVDVRYHLASLVAIFLSLGLGILIGTSLAGDREELHRRDQWLTTLEREFDRVRGRAKEMEASIEQLAAERDRYAAFSGELVEALVAGRLEGRTIATVAIGWVEAAQEVEGFLQVAGAEVIRRVSLRPEALSAPWNELLSPEGPLGAGDPGQALASLVLEGGAGREGELPKASSKLLNAEALSSAQGEADGVVLLLGSASPAASDLFLTLVEGLRNEGATAIALVREEGWRGALDEASVPYVTHFESPMGKLSLLLLLAEGGEGAYGFGSGAPLWPKELFSSKRGEGVG